MTTALAPTTDVAESTSTAPRGVGARARALLAWTSQVAMGALGLAGGLGLAATVPGAQFLTLGWLLEAEGRLARGGGWRGLLPGLTRAAPLGAMLLGGLLLALPALVVGSFARDAALIEPGSELARRLARWTLALGLLGSLQLALVVLRGGRLLHVFRPLQNARWAIGRLRAGARPGQLLSRVREGVTSLRLPHYLALGVRGFLAALAWLAFPTALLVAGPRGPALALLGGVSLVLLLPWLVVAQARLAATGELREAFRVGAIRQRIARAPLSSAAALVLTLAGALPLYAFKVEAIPRDALWMPALLCLSLLLPGRLLAGWAYARGGRPGRAHWCWRLLGAALALPAAGSYVFLVFFTQYFGWSGGLGLYAQHAFMLPVAFH